MPYRPSRYDEISGLTAEALDSMSVRPHDCMRPRAFYRTVLPASAFPPEPDTSEPARAQEVITESDPDRVDADRVEHERMMRLHRWQRQEAR